MKEIVVNSCEELITLIDKIISKSIITLKGQKRKYYFRGQANKEWDLLPGILRQKNCNELIEINKRNNFNIKDNKEISLALIQHYGGITRCLDFTRNYKIALFFACNPNDKYFNNDGALFIWEKDSHMPNWFTNYLVYYVATSNYDEVSSWDFANDIIKKNEIFNEFIRTKRSTNIDKVSAEIQYYLGKGFMVDFEGVSSDERINKQEAALFYFGSEYYYFINEEKIIKKDGFEKWSNDNQLFINLHKLANPKIIDFSYCTKIVIPYQIKQDVLNFIDIDEKDLGLK